MDARSYVSTFFSLGTLRSPRSGFGVLENGGSCMSILSLTLGIVHGIRGYG